MSDLYARLGLTKAASADDIKRAYRKEALSKHPDRGGKKEDFQGLQEAYDVLSDPGKRSHYDMTGQLPGSDSGPGSDMGFAGGMPDLSAMFGSMFPGGMPLVSVTMARRQIAAPTRFMRSVLGSPIYTRVRPSNST